MRLSLNTKLKLAAPPVLLIISLSFTPTYTLTAAGFAATLHDKPT